MTAHPELPPDVLAYYAQGREDGRLSDRDGAPADTRLELWRTQDVLRRTLPPPPARVLDVGGGSGVHSRWLRDDGYRTVLLDPVAPHVAQARAYGLTAEPGDARQLPVADASFDAVLLLGPLYHLPERADRLRALTEARRAVRPGGLVAAAAISRWAPLTDAMLQGHLYAPGRLDRTLEHVRTGHLPDGSMGFTTAWFHEPAALAEEFAEAGLPGAVTHGLEGPAWLIGDMRERLDDPAARATVLAALRAVETAPALLGASAHLLTTARAA
ncbi:class I SAM-dependent methyltransferase [Streptomyces avicenniae]|uniref:class I SAM-dependent methyltransferase n=1 Tax=Streptomyces avicenniae TaxID=500153 RepID=UPI00069AC23B|nr:class I SAM-dependent methyltransferase [Streptomyces avicenniae]